MASVALILFVVPQRLGFTLVRLDVLRMCISSHCMPCLQSLVFMDGRLCLSDRSVSTSVSAYGVEFLNGRYCLWKDATEESKEFSIRLL